ncbi:MAG TPA: CBS domain-containing protein [Holophagaceae bacterium]|nr:CBS domain-containing protein [Holophagaceae bacterium]
MNVNDLCIRNVASCLPETNLASAAALLWDHDCGVLPVVDSSHRIVGVLTDRDICMALATRNKLASDLCAKDVMSKSVHTIRESDSASQALKVMRQNHIRRLPVTDEKERLAGILSLNDLVLGAKEGKASPNVDEVMQTMKAICSHSHPASKKSKERAELTFA